ncbi:hypothetical protein RSAG8_05643, partial [Rhizoctonia solani AG-8 WAC10335]
MRQGLGPSCQRRSMSQTRTSFLTVRGSYTPAHRDIMNMGLSLCTPACTALAGSHEYSCTRSDDTVVTPSAAYQQQETEKTL